MNEHCRGCIRYLKSCIGMSKEVCEKHQLRIPRTKADIIRNMTDKEMAEFFTQDYYDGPKFYCPVQPVIGEGECAMRSDCRQCLLEWLRQEAEE